MQNPNDCKKSLKKYNLYTRLILFDCIFYKTAKQLAFLAFITCFYRSMSYTNLMFLKSDWVGDLTPVVPSVQHSFPGVVVHHGVVAVLVCELYVGVPLFSCFGVVSKVDGSGLAVVAVDTVDHSTSHKRIAHGIHWLCTQENKR